MVVMKIGKIKKKDESIYQSNDSVVIYLFQLILNIIKK